MTETCSAYADTNDADRHAGELTDRQQRFVVEYLIDQNASAAARRCGYSPQSAATQGAALLRIPVVRDRIRMELRTLLAAVGVTLIDLVKERVKAAYFRNGRMFGPSGQLRAIQDMPRDLLEIFEIHITWRLGTPELRLKQPSRERALSALEKMLERLDRQDEKALGRRRTAPGEGVESDPGFAEKHVDLCGSRGPDPAGTRASPKGTSCGASASSARTEEGGDASGTTDGACEILEKPVVLSGSANEISGKPVDLSGPPASPVRAERGRSAREQLSDFDSELDAEQPEPELPTGLRWDRSKPPGYQLEVGTPEEIAAGLAQARARPGEAIRRMPAPGASS